MDYGEPNLAISSGVRGKKSIVPCTTTLGSLDHDIPEKLDTLYRTQVTFLLRHSVLQASSPFRHAAEMRQLLEDHVHPVLMIHSDGGLTIT